MSAKNAVARASATQTKPASVHAATRRRRFVHAFISRRLPLHAMVEAEDVAVKARAELLDAARDPLRRLSVERATHEARNFFHFSFLHAQPRHLVGGDARSGTPADSHV